ncbi:MAG TPA: rhodanese-like domain-containing protein [Geothrix sp.]|uniref:rhodanese-like domain-containing protein n=1 Tax=Geothrix mesophila TaxID=2922723 RepID=UPI001FAC47FF|nr:rhodanese-like domain-containing protein [Geothrix sp. SG198]HJV37723.1 rhodanese-like domain-containing protein [Geothrix sp.]
MSPHAQALTTLRGWMETYPFLPGLVFAALCLLLLFGVALPRLRSWRRGRGRPVLDPLQVEELLQGPGVLLVDLRDEAAFRQGHIRGCLHVPFAELTRRFGSPDPQAKRALVLVDETDALSHRALRLLTARGFEWVYVLQGGMRAWRGASRPMVK